MRRKPTLRTRAERDALIVANLYLPRFLIGKYLRGDPWVRRLGYEDAEGFGFVALIRAAELYDPAAEVTFATYAARCIRGAVRDAAHTYAGVVRVPLRRRRGTPRGCRSLPAWYDLPAPPTPPERAELDALRTALAQLPAPEQRLLRLRFWDGLSRADIGSREGVCGEMVRLREVQALTRLRAALRGPDTTL